MLRGGSPKEMHLAYSHLAVYPKAFVWYVDLDARARNYQMALGELKRNLQG